ncbi:LacI family DNA-binding transcriptional regulator [Agromyces sp. NPDC058110]|uniref:LacI family DNA-binding transcriptional regulator n=1 Tax=Agromyces sp. NPDC058110 TaxID=3346345 RepID=UPI0036DF046F
MNQIANANRRLTLKDVAAEAGVSVSTVSKVINDRHDVGPELRERILATIDAMGFRPNTMARSLRIQRSDTIAIVTDDLEGIFTNTMMRGVEDAAQLAGSGVLLCNSYGDPQRERAQLRRLLDKQVDALIFMSGNRVGPRPSPALPIPPDVPYVYLYEYGDDSVLSILPDDEDGGRIAALHLADVGAQRIALVNGPHEWEATVDRRRGFESGLADRGLALDPRRVRETRSWNPDEAYRVVTDLLAAEPDLDALFCASDDLASGALAAIADSGRSVPGDVKVIGFDNRSMAVHQRPPLTTIALPLLEMGGMAGERVLAASRGETLVGGVVRVPATLVARESTRA